MHLLAKVPSKALRPLHTTERAGPQAPHILSLFSGACHTRERLEGPWIRMGGGQVPRVLPSQSWLPSVAPGG